MSKSYVGLGYDLCPICHAKHNEVVLLDKRVKDTLEHDNFMGFSLCPEHEAMKEEYLALVEAEAPPNCTALRQENAKLTGKVAHLRRTVVKDVFNADIPADMPMIYVEPGVIDLLQARTEQAPKEPT